MGNRLGRRWRIAVVLTAMASGIVMVAPLARAEPADAHGWWWRTQSSLLTGTLPPPPFVPEDGLYVAGTADQEDAVSAVRIALAEGETPMSLTLQIAQAPGPVVVGACATTSQWAPAQAGAWDDRPEADCSRRTLGEVAEDGASVTFDLSGFAGADLLDLTLRPGTAEEGSAAVQVAFEAPDANAFQVQRTQTPTSAPPAAAPGAPTTTTTAPPPRASGAAGPPASSPPAGFGAPSSPPTTTGTTGTSTLAAPTPVPGPVTGIDDALPASSDSGGQQAVRLVAAIIFVLSLGMMSWIYLGQPAWLGRPITLGRDRGPDHIAGVGRFASPRAGPTPRL